MLLAAAADMPVEDRLAAFGEIVRRFQDMAYGCAYSILGDFHLAEDAAQEAFMTAYQKLSGLRAPAAFPGWLRRIVMTQCNRMVRGKRIETMNLAAAAEVSSAEPPPAQAAEKRELKDKVLAAIRSLPDAQRMVVTLFYINGYSQKDIAEFLEVPVTTVKKRLFSSRSRLRRRMIAMVDETLKSFPLPDRFSDVVVQMRYVADRIDPLAARMRALSGEQMLARSAELRRRLAVGEGRDAIKAEAFALVREASARALGTPQYDVQLVAAMILDKGWIAEQATGEGKTITCYPAVYMAALEGMHVHVTTVNDYLARRDAAYAEKVFSLLGVTVGCITSDLPALPTRGDGAAARKEAYLCDVTYGSWSEFGFDSLRDTLKAAGARKVQGPMDFAIIDEADSVLLDEARGPMTICRQEDGDPGRYRQADAVARELIARARAGGREFYKVDPEHKWDILLTDEGAAAAEQTAGTGSFGDESKAEWPLLIRQALRARLLYEKDSQYVVQDGRVIILDPHLGRPRVGQMWFEGLHQAIEAKEGVEISPQKRTVATVTIPEYFKQYRKLAGMTGTATTQAAEFRQEYGMDVGVVPTRRPVNRVDSSDRLYSDAGAKYDAVVEEIRHYSHDLRRPVLVGASGIEASEKLSEMLEKQGIKHKVLNARPESAAHEAEIIAAAGEQIPRRDASGETAGAVTIATNMAGRGTDIRLGEGVVFAGCRVPPAEKLAELGLEAEDLFPPGSVKCCIFCTDYDEATGCVQCFKPKLDGQFPHRGRSACRLEPPCGLHVVGAQRHGSRRLDNQLRFRAGRQGEPGSSRFFLSLEDELLADAVDEIKAIAGADLRTGGPIESARISKVIERAQKAAEKHDRQIRRQFAICGPS